MCLGWRSVSDVFDVLRIVLFGCSAVFVPVITLPAQTQNENSCKSWPNHSRTYLSHDNCWMGHSRRWTSSTNLFLKIRQPMLTSFQNTDTLKLFEMWDWGHSNSRSCNFLLVKSPILIHMRNIKQYRKSCHHKSDGAGDEAQNVMTDDKNEPVIGCA